MNKKTPAVKENSLPAQNSMYAQFEQDASEGFENVTAQDMALPFIHVIQSNSPQVMADTAKPGEFWHVVKKQSLGKTIKVIPVNFQKVYIEWQSRESGGGFVAYHFDESILQSAPRDENNRNTLPNGNYISTTAYHFCLLLNDGIPEPVIISLSSTQLKNSRRWLSMARNLKLNIGDKIITPPMYSHIYTIETILESNSKGSWFGCNIHSPKLLNESEINFYQMAQVFYKETSEDITKVMPAAPIDGDEPTSNIDNEEKLSNETEAF